MKRIYILVLAFLIMAGTASAQKFYARLGVGIGLGIAYYDGTVDRTIQGNNSDISVSRSNSLGTGLNINLAGGYMFSKFIGVDLGFNEFIGFGVKTKYSQTQTNYSQQFDDKYAGMSFRIVPALVITPGFEKINPYGRFGIIIGVINQTTYSFTNTQTGEVSTKAAATTVTTKKEKDTGGISLGFAAAVGADYNLSNQLAFFAEINLNGVNYSPTKGKLTEWTKDGVDQLPGTATKDKEWEYVKTIDNNEVIPSTSPDKYRKETALLTNVGISIGVKFSFGGAK